MLEVGRRHIELPAVVTLFGFEAHRGRLAGEARMIQMPLAQIDIDGALMEHPCGARISPWDVSTPYCSRSSIARCVDRWRPCLFVVRSLRAAISSQ